MAEHLHACVSCGDNTSTLHFHTRKRNWRGNGLDLLLESRWAHWLYRLRTLQYSLCVKVLVETRIGSVATVEHPLPGCKLKQNKSYTQCLTFYALCQNAWAEGEPCKSRPTPSFAGGVWRCSIRHRSDDPLNLTILVSGGKETYKDYLSCGEGGKPSTKSSPDWWRTGDRLHGVAPGTDSSLLRHSSATLGSSLFGDRTGR